MADKKTKGLWVVTVRERVRGREEGQQARAADRLPGCKMTDRRFLDVAEEFIKVKESMGLSEQTILTYRWNIKYFVKWAGAAERFA